jgi:hypothetical protein
MFERPHHKLPARVLSALNGNLLKEHGCLFGGGIIFRVFAQLRF